MRWLIVLCVLLVPTAVRATAMVDTLYPDGDGTTQQWDVGTGCTNHWECVEEGVPGDDATSYLETEVNSEDELFTLTDFTPTDLDVIDSVVPIGRSQGHGGGTKVCSFRVRSGSTTYTGLTHNEVNGTWTTHRDTAWTIDPNGGGAWTDADVDAVEIGYRSETGHTTGQGGRGTELTSIGLIVYWQSASTAAAQYRRTRLLKLTQGLK